MALFLPIQHLYARPTFASELCEKTKSAEYPFSGNGWQQRCMTLRPEKQLSCQNLTMG
jgi:hypothetical protein